MNWLKQICDENNVTVYELAKKMNRATQTLYDWDNRYINNLKLSDCELIANALEMTIVEFMNKYYNKYKKG